VLKRDPARNTGFLVSRHYCMYWYSAHQDVKVGLSGLPSVHCAGATVRLLQGGKNHWTRSILENSNWNNCLFSLRNAVFGVVSTNKLAFCIFLIVFFRMGSANRTGWTSGWQHGET
jgi:hypothetical protein